MVERHLRRRGIRDDGVLQTMARVPRHAFVPPEWRREAYADSPLPIGEGQTISQPYIVAVMTEALSLRGCEKVLEIGTGCGYQTAILAELADVIWTTERSPALARGARIRLRELGYRRIHIEQGDGTVGLEREAPFDRIIATGSLPNAPAGLLDQLVEGGILVAPIGNLCEQQLIRLESTGNGVRRRSLGACRFVPLVGVAGWDERAAGRTYQRSEYTGKTDERGRLGID